MPVGRGEGANFQGNFKGLVQNAQAEVKVWKKGQYWIFGLLDESFSPFVNSALE